MVESGELEEVWKIKRHMPRRRKVQHGKSYDRDPTARVDGKRDRVREWGGVSKDEKLQYRRRNAMQIALNAFDDAVIWFQYLSVAPRLPQRCVDFQFLFARSFLIIIPVSTEFSILLLLVPANICRCIFIFGFTPFIVVCWISIWSCLELRYWRCEALRVSLRALKTSSAWLLSAQGV